MLRVAAVITVTATAGLFGWGIDLPHLYTALQPLTVSLSIMIAALFVRLNRGMPTLDWKSLQVDERRRLTGSILSLTKEYALIVALFAVTLIAVVSLTVIGEAALTTRSSWIKIAIISGMGALISLSLLRMAYVVWRDVDIVRLQKILLDAAGEREHADKVTGSASEKISTMRSAGLRRVPLEAPRQWNS